MARKTVVPHPRPAIESREPAHTGGDWVSDHDLSDLLSELRILLPGAQTLTAFLIILPFNTGFEQISELERFVYLTTFLCALVSLILFAAPAAWHRLMRPLRDRDRFKTQATHSVICGLATLSVALTLATQLVVDAVLHRSWLSWGSALIVALFIVTIWWLMPRRLKRGHREPVR